MMLALHIDGDGGDGGDAKFWRREILGLFGGRPYPFRHSPLPLPSSLRSNNEVLLCKRRIVTEVCKQGAWCSSCREVSLCESHHVSLTS